jgi:hypothetical protein
MWTLGAPWGLLALAGIPAILAIHWFRRRSQPLRVTGLFLWPAPAPSAAGGRRRERVVSLPSLWCELLAVLAFTWWLADLHPTADERGQQLVVVLDDRLRLQAAQPGGLTAATRIQRELSARFATLRAADRVTLIASGATPRILAGPGATPAAATQALANWQPAAAWHDLGPALALAQQLAALGSGSGSAGGQWLVASDRQPDDLPPGAGLLACGEIVATTGLADVRWLRDGAGERLVVRVAGTAAARPLILSHEGRDLARLPSVGPGTVLIPLNGAAASALPAELDVVLDGPDPLPADDRVRVRRPPERLVRVAEDVPAAIKPLITQVLAAVPGILPGGLTPDLLITTTSASGPGTWRLRLAPAGSAAALGPFLTRAGHPLCRDLDGSGMLWVGGSDLGPITSEALLSAGNQVLYREQRRGRDRLLDLHADLQAGTLVQHPLWPALIANLIETRRAFLPGCAEATIPVGRSTTVVLPAAEQEVQLSGPGATAVTLVADADGQVLLPALERAGSWQLHLSGKPWLTLEAVALDARQADFAAAVSSMRDPAAAEAVAVERRRSPAEWVLPLLAAAAAMLAAWAWARRGR